MTALPARPLRRILLSTLATVSGVVLLLSLKPHSTATATAASAPSTTPAPSATSSPSAGSSPAAGAAGTRTVDGDTAQTEFGPVQLRVTLTDGKITAVSTLQLPNDYPLDSEISDFAIPKLTKEALSAQSAQIDTVSGATYTSEGYQQSLQSALDKAGV